MLTPAERFLNLFTEVRRGEASSALLLALNIFLILTAYYILKPVREALILSGDGGAEIFWRASGYHGVAADSAFWLLCHCLLPAFDHGQVGQVG